MYTVVTALLASAGNLFLPQADADQAKMSSRKLYVWGQCMGGGEMKRVAKCPACSFEVACGLSSD